MALESISINHGRSMEACSSQWELVGNIGLSDYVRMRHGNQAQPATDMLRHGHRSIHPKLMPPSPECFWDGSRFIITRI